MLREDALHDNVVNLLTLRHNPLNTRHSFRRLTPADFAHFLPKVDYRYLETMLSKTIKRIFREKKPKSVAVPLSGGVDSTLIAQLVSELKPKDCTLYTVSMGFGHATDETYEARKIAKEIGNNEFRAFEIPNVLVDLEKHVSLVKEPRWNTYYAYVVQYVKETLGTSLMITGDGGDELFGGYGFRYHKFLSEYGGSLSWSLKKALAYLEAAYGRDYVTDQQQLFNAKVGFSWDNIVELLRPSFDNNLDPLNQFFMADFNGKLVHDYVPTNQAFYNYYGVTGFCPLLQNEVIDFACKILPQDKYSYDNSLGKLPLRAILVSKGLSKFMLPQKTGYGTDLVHLWKVAGCPKACMLIGNPLVVRYGIISRSWIDKHLDPDLDDARYINKFLQLVALEYYLKERLV